MGEEVCSCSYSLEMLSGTGRFRACDITGASVAMATVLPPDNTTLQQNQVQSWSPGPRAGKQKQGCICT